MNSKQVWQKFNKDLLYFIQSRVGNVADAQDIHSDVFLKVIQNSDQLDNIENLHAWVYHIAKNKIVDHYRNSKAKETLTDNIPDENDVDPIEELTDEQLRGCLRKLITNLPVDYQKALVATQILEIPDKEYADAAQISLSKAKSLIHRGKRKLQEIAVECNGNCLNSDCTNCCI